MYFYHGNRHYYLTRIFLNDKELQEIVYASGLLGDYERFSYALADELYTSMDSFLKNNSLSANEYYEREYSKWSANASYISTFLNKIQQAIFDAYEKTYIWYHRNNKGLYVAILKSLLYGSIKHFFFENRDKYLPQYDWYLINNNPKRKDIMDMLFREFDKLTNAVDSLRYYQDADDIPLELLIYLQEITGLTVNDYDGVFTDKQIRSLTKHLVEVWREKGSLFSIELFFACMGIQCDTSELWFDRRLFDNPKNFNEYTKVQSVRSFGYYLTPEKPHTVSYEFSPESVSYNMYTSPRSSRIWEYVVGKSVEGTEEVRNLLGISSTPEKITYTFFKSNYVLINFSYIGSSNRSITKDELLIFKELINYMLPAFIRTYYGNEYEAAYGNDDWDILNGKDNSTEVIDENGKAREATPLSLFDTQIVNGGTDLNPYYLYDAYPSSVVGEKYVSGSYIVFNDYRLSQFLTNADNGHVLTFSSISDIPDDTIFYGSKHNYKSVKIDNEVYVYTTDKIELDDVGGTVYHKLYGDDGKYFVDVDESTDELIPFAIDTLDELVSSSKYDVIGGGLIENDTYPAFYDSQYNYLNLGGNVLIRLDGTIDPQDPDVVINTTGTLVIEKSDDVTDTTEDTLTTYYFKDNNDNTIRIYPCLFAEDNNGSVIHINEGHYDMEGNYDETFSIVIEPQINWVYDIESTEEVEELPYETFDPPYITGQFYNLFESSSYHDEAFAVNELYNDDNSWNGDIQYEYYEYTNPLEYIDSKLDSSLQITLI